MKDNIYNEIVSLDNIQKAYFEVAEKLTAKGISNTYVGVDGLLLQDLDSRVNELSHTIRQELIEEKKLIPAGCHEIFKRSGGVREVYIYSLKDRIKDRAISRILEPIFEKVYSPFLFSYRSSHPSNFAAKSVKRRYLRHYGKDNVMVVDLKKFFYSIDRDILIEQLVDLGLSDDVIKLIKLFLNQKVVKDKRIVLPQKGIVLGISLAVLFANLYLNKIDWYIGKKVSFYRRVGDDLIVFDKDPNKIESIYNFLHSELDKLKLKLSKEKTKIINSSESFEYLGYLFYNNVVAISPSSEEKIYIKITSELKYYPIDFEEKKLLLKKKVYEGSEGLYYYMKNTISHYNCANDYEQIKRISERIFHIITRYYFKTYSQKNRRLTNRLCKDLRIPSFYKLYLSYHNARSKR